ncbi:glycosyltransferase [Hamadaea sp. NPDC050747]|uniref:glycosyltransferase n=1 Tax=Hamadaea sp. NPDC050747 TaxID=3155789 RepID=UPI0033E13DA2
MIDAIGTPKVSVVIPTYNRAALLRLMLEQLARQTLPKAEFEVVVADDGSADDTAEVVAAFQDRLRLKYFFQEDVGDRVSRARNEGAKLADAEVLIFLDSGVMISADLVERHLALHRTGEPLFVCGYAWGYDPRFPPIEDLHRRLAVETPEDVLARYRDEPAFRDVRHEALVTWDFEMNAMPLPWQLVFGLNISLPAEVFRRVGGFNEDMTEWGCEDLEIGFKAHRLGVPFRFAMDAWVIEWPHERDMSARWPQMVANMAKFLVAYPEPVIEIGYVLCAVNEYWRWEETWLELGRWTEQAGTIDVADEVARAVADVGADERIAIFGAGGTLPPGLPPAVIVDFDAELLEKATRGTPHTPSHAVGVRTVLPDQSVDRVLVTSRLTGLWPTWSDHILTEAGRIGRRVEVLHAPAAG